MLRIYFLGSGFFTKISFHDKLSSLGVALFLKKGFLRYELLFTNRLLCWGAQIDSWGRSACYPRRTFCPMSDGPSIQNHRITKTNFRSCSTCLSCSQAPLCLCTQRPVSNRPEGTFALLRYSLGGDRPSQTTHQTVSLPLIQRAKLESKSNQGGISRLTPL